MKKQTNKKPLLRHFFSNPQTLNMIIFYSAYYNEDLFFNNNTPLQTRDIKQKIKIHTIFIL